LLDEEELREFLDLSMRRLEEFLRSFWRMSFETL